MKKLLLLSSLLFISACTNLLQPNLPPLTSEPPPPESSKYSAPIKDQRFIRAYQTYKKYFDSAYGYQHHNFWCDKDDTENKISAFSDESALCIQSTKLIKNYLGNKNPFNPEGNKLPFLKEFKEKEYDNAPIFSQNDEEMLIDYVIAHELGHLYEPLYFGDAAMINTFLYGTGHRNQSFTLMRTEIFAELIAVTALKEHYGDTPKLRDFVKKLRTNRLIIASHSYAHKRSHFMGIMFKDGIDLALSFSFKPEDLQKLLETAYYLAMESYKYLGPVYDENKIKAYYDLLSVGVQCHKRNEKRENPCYRAWGIDKKISMMSYPEYKREYDRVFTKYFGEYKR